MDEDSHKPKKPKKPRKGRDESSANLALTAEEIEEVRRTELELDIEKPKFICIVHKGPIDGEIYLCPHCHTFYCEKCAKTLKLQDERCWACGNKITISIAKIEGLNTSLEDMITVLDTELKEDLPEKNHKKVEKLRKKIIKAEKYLIEGEFKKATEKYEKAILLAVESGEAEIASALTAKTTQIKRLTPESDQKRQKEKKSEEELDKHMFKAAKKLTKKIQKQTLKESKEFKESLDSKVLKASVQLTKKIQNMDEKEN